MSLRFVPHQSHPTQTSNLTTSNNGPSLTLGAPAAPGVPDRLRSGQEASATTSSSHPLESRLTQWRSTQEQLKMESLRRVYGIAEPVRRQMELKMVREGAWRPMALGQGGSVQEDILTGRDSEIDWEDVFKTREELGVEERGSGLHDEMEAKVKMNSW